MPVITTEQLEDASRDVIDLGLVMNSSSDDPDIVTRLGEIMPPLAKVLAALNLPGAGDIYPNAYASALPRGVMSGTVGGDAVTGATPGTYALTPTGGSITGVEAFLVVNSATSASIVISNPGLGTGTTPPTWAKPAGATLPAGTTITAVVAPRVPTSGRYLALSADGESLQLYKNDGTSTPAIVTGVAISTTLSTLTTKKSAEAHNVAREQPNLLSQAMVTFEDLSGWIGSVLPVKEVFSTSGHPCRGQATGKLTTAVGAGASPNYVFPRSSIPGNRFSASVRVAAADAAAGTSSSASVNRFLVIQADAGNVEIAGTRATVSMFGAAGLAGPATFSHPSMTIHADCVAIWFIIEITAVGSTAGVPRSMWFQRPLIAAGEDPAWRPPVVRAATTDEAAAGTGEGFVLPSQLNGALASSTIGEAFAVSREQPNLFSQEAATFSDLSKWIGSTVSLVAEIFDGSDHPCDGQVTGKFTVAVGAGASRMHIFQRADIPGDMMSASIRLVRADAAAGTSSATSANRFIVIQRNSGGGEISGTRRTTPMFGAAGLEGPITFSHSKIDIHADCVTVEVVAEITAVGSTAGVARNMWLQRPLLAAGGDASWRPPVVRAATSAEALALTGPGFVSPPQLGSILSGREASAAFRPNLLTADEISTLGSSRLFVLGTGASAQIVTVDGAPAFELTTTTGGTTLAALEWRVPRSAFDDTLNPAIGIQFYEIDAAVSGTGTTRLLKRQFDAGVEIVAARESINITTGGTALAASLLRAATRLEANAWHADADEVSMYVEITNTGSAPRSVVVRFPMIASGDAAFRAPSSAVSTGGGSSPVIVVDPNTGDDDDPGSSAAPKATLAAAILAAIPSGTVIMRDGDYVADTLPLGGAYGLTLMAEAHARPTIVGGTKLTGITKTGGYTKVYQATVSAGISAFLVAAQADASDREKTWIFQRGVADPTTLIDIDERHPLHRGQTHRLEDICRAWNVASEAAIDAASGSSWFIDGTTLYFSLEDGGDATVADMYAPDINCVTGLTGSQYVRIVGLETRFIGLYFNNAAAIDLYGVRCLGGRNEGITFDGTQHTRIRHCESGASGQDCFNNHTYLGAYRSNYELAELWGHDCGDDGRSPHEYCEGSDDHSLYEYNYDRGVIVSYGAHEQNSNSIARKNGWGTGAAGEGFTAAGGATEGEDTILISRNCLSIGNQRNFDASVDASCRHIVIDGVSIDPVIAHLSGRGGAALEFLRTSYSGAGTVKETSTGGTVTALATLTTVT